MPSFAAHGLAASRGERRLFSGLGFSLGAGDALELRGPNGSGKSTLLRLLAGFLRPDAGQVLWDGGDIRDDLDAHRTRLRYLGHQDAIKPALIVSETFRFWSALDGGPAPSAERIKAALAAWGVARLASLPCRALSAGQRRRLALARLEARPVALWLLDEPTVGLDTEARELFEASIARHRAAGGIIIVSTHEPLDLRDATRLQLADFTPAIRSRAAAAALDLADSW